MGKWCLHASLFIFDRIIIKVAGSQDRHESSVKFDFGPNQTTHFGVTCPWVTKISHFRTWISLNPVGQSWSNFMCSIIGVGERLHKVLGQIDMAHWTQVSDRCPLGYLFYSITLTAFVRFCSDLHHTITIRQCMFDRKIRAEGSVFQDLCHFVILTIRCFYFDW